MGCRGHIADRPTLLLNLLHGVAEVCGKAVPQWCGDRILRFRGDFSHLQLNHSCTQDTTASWGMLALMILMIFYGQLSARPLLYTYHTHQLLSRQRPFPTLPGDTAWPTPGFLNAATPVLSLRIFEGFSPVCTIYIHVFIALTKKQTNLNTNNTSIPQGAYCTVPPAGGGPMSVY